MVNLLLVTWQFIVLSVSNLLGCKCPDVVTPTEVNTGMGLMVRRRMQRLPTQDYGMRIYDERLGRFLSVDPITKQYPELTLYQFASNRPIVGVDHHGLEYARFDVYLEKNNNVIKIIVTKDYDLKEWCQRSRY